MTEAEALKRFIPILGRISTPGERVTITRNILERIAGQKTSVMGVSHKHAGALAWPNDHVKALAFERALDTAVDAGEFVSFLHRADRHHFQIEELSAWPNCPKVDTESPLTYWLSNAAQTAATPAPVVAVGASGGDEQWKEKARARADEIIKRDKAKNLYPSQENISDEIAKQFRRDGVTGADGKPLSGAYIKRHALKGISSAQSKLVSTVMRRGK